MLDAVIRFALKHRPLIVFLSLAVLLYGTYSATTLRLDVLPDLDRPRVVVLTEAAGLAPEDVERRITQPLETALLGSQGVQAVRSQSSPALSVITVEFDWTTPIRAARQTIQERLTTVSLPKDIKPVLTPVSSILGQILNVGLHRQKGPRGGDLTPVGDTGLLAERLADGSVTVWRPVERRHPQTWERVAVAESGSVLIEGRKQEVTFPTDLKQRMELGTIAAWDLRPRLMQVPGVAEVLVQGGERKQYQVVVDPDALADERIPLEQVEKAVRESNIVGSGGFSERGDNERPVRILGQLGPMPADVLAQLLKVVVKADSKRPVTLAQLATVREGPQPKRGDGGIDGHEGIVLTVVRQPHADTRALTERIVKTLDEAEASLSADLIINPELFQLRRFIDQGIYYVGEALVIGAVLVLIILTLFLLNARTTFISLTAIPLSLAITTLVFRLVSKLTGTELSINVMTLGGIAVAMGELVDDSIVDVENIFRRLRENRAAPEPKPALRVVYEASREVRGAIVFGTIVVILVFLPLFALSGLEGRLFTPLAIAYVVSILASLLVSLTVTPVMAYHLLPRAKATHREGDGWLLRNLKRLARPTIRFSMAHATALLVLTWVGVGLAAFQLTRLGRDFLPRFDEGSVQVNATLPPGSSLKAANRDAAILDRKLASLRKSDDNPEGPLLHFSRKTGRAEFDEHAMPVNQTEYILNVDPKTRMSRESLLKKLETELRAALPGVDIEVEQPMAHAISHMLSGVSAHVAIVIQGDELNQLRQIATRIKEAIGDVKGVTAVIEAQRLAAEVHIRLREDDLELHGVTREQVARYLETALQGTGVTQVIDGRRRFDVVVRFDERWRDDPSLLPRLRVELPDGSRVALEELADLNDDLGPNVVRRENGQRRLVVRCTVRDRDLGGAADEIERLVKEKVTLPAGYTVEYGGQLESQRRATGVILGLSAVSLAGIFVTLLVLYPSVRIVLQVLNAVPAAFIGGVLALMLTGQTLTVASLVGFVSLAGIAVRNGILLMSHYLHLMRHEGEKFSESMIERGSLERLAPVLMTALTAGIALVPLVLSGHKPGLEILYPVATVILGGLVTSTLCEFLLHPGLFWRFSGRDGERLARTTHHQDL